MLALFFALTVVFWTSVTFRNWVLAASCSLVFQVFPWIRKWLLFEICPGLTDYPWCTWYLMFYSSATGIGESAVLYMCTSSGPADLRIRDLKTVTFCWLICICFIYQTGLLVSRHSELHSGHQSRNLMTSSKVLTLIYGFVMDLSCNCRIL